MVRPDQVIDPRCSTWEERIDSQLQSHDWSSEKPCDVHLHTTSPSLRALLERYQKLGWGIEITDVDMVECCTTCRFALHPSWWEEKGVLKPDNDLLRIP